MQCLFKADLPKHCHFTPVPVLCLPLHCTHLEVACCASSVGSCLCAVQGRCCECILAMAQGGLDLNIDMSALDIVTSEEFAQQQVFGQKWMVQLVPKRPPDVKPDRILSLAEYRRRLANIVG